jgi:Zn-dependent peptidase ImmA (M78 family)
MSFSPLRLSIARKRAMLNKKGFSDAIGVTQHAVVRWEKGQAVPTPENITAIVKALGFPERFFFGDDLDEPNDASFRSQTSMSAAIRDAALAAGVLGFMISDWVENRFNLPEINVPDLRHYDAVSAARALREEWSLGERPITNMVHLLESRGVRVFSLAENTVKVNAYSIWRKEKPYIFLNTFKSAESSRFDAAHELAHLVLHQDGGYTGREAEDQANIFASSFLMPNADIRAHIPYVYDFSQIIRAKSRWRVSAAALCYRLHKMGIITDWKYRDFCIEMTSRGYNKNEPLPIDRETSEVWQKVLRALWAEKTTQKHIADDLALPETEVNGLIFGMVAASAPVAPLVGRPQLALVNAVN